jgi:hypothetical protein
VNNAFRSNAFGSNAVASYAFHGPAAASASLPPSQAGAGGGSARPQSIRRPKPPKRPWVEDEIALALAVIEALDDF